MERAISMTGIGGQGVQLCARVLALAATREGREVMMFGSYGGMMRGGNTDATVVVADEPITAPPIVSRVWCGLVMHDEYAAPQLARVAPEGFVVLNGGLADGGEIAHDRVLVVPATQIATDLGAAVTAAQVLLGAFVETSGIVDVASCVAVLEDALPPYRSDRIDINRDALAAGAQLAEAEPQYSAWDAAVPS